MSTVAPAATTAVLGQARERDALERRARRLAWAANAWHMLEFGVALAAGLAAGSIALVAAPTMPLLARAKYRVGAALGSRATQSEGRQNQICAYLAPTLLVGLGANAAFGWWWADPVAGIAIAAVALAEGRAAWAGGADHCC